MTANTKRREAAIAAASFLAALALLGKPFSGGAPPLRLTELFLIAGKHGTAVLGAVVLVAGGAGLLFLLQRVVRKRRRKKDQPDEFEHVREIPKSPAQQMLSVFGTFAAAAVIGMFLMYAAAVRLTRTENVVVPSHAAQQAERIVAAPPGPGVANPGVSDEGGSDIFALEMKIGFLLLGGYFFVFLVSILWDRPFSATGSPVSEASCAGRGVDGERHVLAVPDFDTICAMEPRPAVVECYAAFRSLMESAGYSASDAETAEEYLVGLPEGFDALRSPAGRLTALFEEARFSADAVRSELRADAVGCTRRIVGIVEDAKNVRKGGRRT